ncbi:MAG: Bug family tripartite tricarboxylate transporter substrate binding protein [Polaromonas sp.]
MAFNEALRPDSWRRAGRSICHHALAAVLATAVLATLSVMPSSASAQGWPAKPIRLVVNFPPGSSPDVVGRAIALPLQQALGQPVVVENRSGAAGLVGGDLVAKAPADGYTLLMSSGSAIAINPHIYAKMPFDPAKDLVPVAAVARIELFLVVRPELPAKTIKEFLAHLKANPGKLSYGSSGNGTTPHIAGEMLKSQLGVFAVHVPYRGSSPALQDLLAGQIDYIFDPGIAFPHVKAGKLRLLAVGGRKRSALFPDVPTLDEAGVKGFDASTTHAVYAPAGTPSEIVNRLNSEINRVLAMPAVRSQILALGGAEPTPMSPAQLRTISEQDGKRYGAIIRERNIQPD